MNPLRMKHFKNRYLELITMTNLYLFREHPFPKRKADPRTSPQFKQLAAPPDNLPTKITTQVDLMASPASEPSSKSEEKPIEKPSITQSCEEQREKRVQKQFFSFEKPVSSHSNPWPIFFPIIHAHFPNLSLREEILNDNLAKKMKDNWKANQQISPVVILSFRENAKEQLFLQNLAKAISLHFFEARVYPASTFEKEKKWEQLLNDSKLKLIIASDSDLYLQPELMKQHRDEPSKGKHYLNQTALLPISDPTLYFEQRKLKAYLWQAICQHFSQAD
jgi:hypothetical protein